MRRSTFITWDQLKVGGLIVLALVILTVAVVRLGEAAKLFSRRYELVAFLPRAMNLREGSTVTVAGQLAGSVKRIEFLPPDADTTRNLKVTFVVDEALREQIREDSRAKVRTLGLLGEKVVDIAPGTLRMAVLTPGDTVPVEESLDYEEVIAQASGAVEDMVVLAHDLRAITGGIVRGDGTMGQLLMNRTLYDQLNATLAQATTLMRRLERADGTFGRLIDDPTLYERAVSVTGSLDTLARRMTGRQGTMGRLLADDSLYTKLVSITSAADSALKLMTRGDGFAARMLNDQELYDKLTKAVTDLNAILEDVRRNPQKYTRGMIKVF